MVSRKSHRNWYSQDYSPACEHSERRVIKTERLEKIIIAALKQSQQFYLPELASPQSFNAFVATNPKGFIAHCQEGFKESFFNAVTPEGEVVLLIGPEGDFSMQEVEHAVAKGYIPVSLGNQRLRTETAAVVGCYTVALKAQ